MFLMAACLSVFGLAVTCIAFGVATRDQELPAVEMKPALTVQPARFFSERAGSALPLPPRVPIEALLLQIESHVRLEQAAAESFLESPTPALLHSRTMSPLVN
jgi:hypothetical protein